MAEFNFVDFVDKLLRCFGYWLTYHPLVKGELLVVQVSLIERQVCDHCDKQNSEVLYCFEFKTPEGKSVQMWLHKTCLKELQDDALEV